MYLRFPHIHDDLVTFVAADEVWLAPATGGRAWQLSSDDVPVAEPRFSPDGRHIAWTSRKYGHPEVHVIDLEAGGSRRLTWLASTLLKVLGWADAEHVLIATNAGAIENREMNVHTVGLDEVVTRLDIGAAMGLAVHPGGARALSSVNGRSPAMWKRYRGGTAPRLWLDPAGEGSWQRLLPQETAGLVDPMWVGDTLCFVSDRGPNWPGSTRDQANLWAFDDLAGEPRQITSHDEEQGYVRDAATDGTRVVYSCHGDLYRLDGLDEEPVRLDITAPHRQAPVQFLDPADRLESVVPDHHGHISTVTTRGRTFRLPHVDGPARALVADSAVRAQHAQPLGTDGSVIMVTDQGGDDGITIVAADGSVTTHGTGDFGTVLHLAATADGSLAATISHDGWIRLHDLASGRTRQVHRSDQGEAENPTFAPDGTLLVWHEPTTGEAEHHRLMATAVTLDDAEVLALTSGRFHETEPAFSRDGRHLTFLSSRTFDPVYDDHSFDLNFAAATRPWLVPLAATEPAPFGPQLDGRQPAASSSEDAGAPDGAAGADAAPRRETARQRLSVAGFEQRMLPFPVPSGNYRSLQATSKGIAWVHENSDRGTLQARTAGSDAKADDVLEHFAFDIGQVEVLLDKVDQYRVSGDGERMVVVADDAVSARPATRRVDKDDDPSVSSVDLGRITFEVDLRAEWLQMFDEQARLMERHFWRADMDGVDWAAVCARYRPLVSRLDRHSELVDLLWETVGELNTSHAYVIDPTPPGDQSRRLGLLGADLSPVAEGWRIDRILAAESSDPKARSPLTAPGVAAAAGDVIVQVNGRPVLPPQPPAAALAGLAEAPVELVLCRDGSDRRVVVVPLSTEEDVRYHDWVAARRARVEAASDGRLGYLHVPDMQARGWAQLHRDLQAATAKEGVILDVRYNRGGHTSELVLERLLRRPMAWDHGRHLAASSTWPDQAPRGPVVLVTNEHAGSDGDIVNANAQQFGLTVVGLRTWGGVVGIDGRFDLVDGTRITQPRYAFHFNDRGWSVEGHGVDPDIEVVHAPGDTLADRDHQLDRAVAEALQQLAQTPAVTAPVPGAPRVSG